MAQNAKNFDVIIRPVITEKSTLLSADNKVVFIVSTNSTKPLIKAAVEDIFGVKVKNVNTLKTKGKAKRFKGFLGKRSDYKKAVVTLEQGQNIDFTNTVK
jgi:large subunit ribosomal protein L23